MSISPLLRLPWRGNSERCLTNSAEQQVYEELVEFIARCGRDHKQSALLKKHGAVLVKRLDSDSDTEFPPFCLRLPLLSC